MTTTKAACVAALLAGAGCGGRSGVVVEGGGDHGGTAGVAGTPMIGGTTGASPSGGSSGSMATGGSAGSLVTGGSGGTAGTAGTVGTTFCDDFAVDLQTSPIHCGSCFNDCRDGACNRGRCSPAPVTIADANYEPQPGTVGVDIALDRTHVYVAEGDTGRVRSVVKSGGDFGDLAVDLDEPCSIVVSEKFVYFATCGDSRVSRVATTGGVLESLLTATPDAKLAFVNGELYVASRGTIQSLSEADLVVKLLARPEAIWPLADLQADTALVYWAVRDLGSGIDGLYAAGVSGDLDLGRIAPVDDLLGFVVVGFHLYATTGSAFQTSGDVIQHALDTGAFTPLVTGERQPRYVAADDEHVFYSVDHYDFVLRRVSIYGDHTPYSLASGRISDEDGYRSVFDLAIDDSYVYFATGSAIKRVPK